MLQKMESKHHSHSYYIATITQYLQKDFLKIN